MDRGNTTEVTCQLAPPGGHSKDAKKAVQVGKYHSIFILCGTSKKIQCNFGIAYYHTPRQPLTCYDQQECRQVSAYAYMHGKHNFNAHPLDTLDMKVKMHLKPDARETWQEHSASGFNVGTSFEHYRCYEVWIKETKVSR